MIAYDGAGRLATYTAAGVATTFSHDSAGFRERAAKTVIDAVGGARTYERGYAYDTYGRIATMTHPSGLKARYGYNARGYRTTLTDAATGKALETMDAFGNVTRTTYGSGVAETRAFDAKTGWPRAVATISGGGTKIRDDAYAWRGDGLLASRASHIGGTNAKLEEFDRDPLGWLTKTTTKLGGAAKRTLSYKYDAKGNLTAKPSSVDADIDVSAYGYDAAKPHRLSSATIGGKAYRFAHDADGNIERYDCVPAGCDDRFVEWDGRNLPVRITVGSGKADKTPTARDEFAYGPDGARYYRKATYKDADDALRTERTYHVGESEELLPPKGAEHASVMRTRVSDAVRHVRTAKPGTDAEGKERTVVDSYFEYVHKDHLGSAEAITDASGKIVRALAHDPYGSRREADWTAALSEAEIVDLAGSPGPRERGHAGHEHLDRTGLIHRGGRIYDPALGRFLSPDPLVADPGSAQAWNGYAYVSNGPMSYVDPSGLVRAGPGCNIGPVMCLDDGGSGAAGGGFGVETVVSTFSFRFVDVLVSRVPIWNHDPDRVFGEPDSFDPFRYEYVLRQGGITVSSRVPVAGVPNITRRPIGLPSFDHGVPDRFDPQTAIHVPVVIAGILIRAGFRKAAQWIGQRWARHKEREQAKRDAAYPGNSELDEGTESATQPPLRRIHSDETLTTGSNRFDYERLRKLSTEEIVRSLEPGSRDPLSVKRDGTIIDGNTRVKIIEDREYDINSLPCEIYSP